MILSVECMDNERCCNQPTGFKQTSSPEKAFLAWIFVLATLKPEKVRRMLKVEDRHVSMISMGQKACWISAFFVSFLCPSFLFPPKNRQLFNKKTCLPNQPNQPQVQIRSKNPLVKNSLRPPTNQTKRSTPDHTNQPFG